MFYSSEAKVVRSKGHAYMSGVHRAHCVLNVRMMMVFAAGKRKKEGDEEGDVEGQGNARGNKRARTQAPHAPKVCALWLASRLVRLKPLGMWLCTIAACRSSFAAAG